MKTNKQFAKDLKKGIEVQHMVAAKIMQSGLAVQVPSVEYKTGEWAEMDIDIIVGHTEQSVIEVKSRRRLSFTDAESYDYPTVFVDAVGKYNKKIVRPSWYVIVNQFNNAMVCIDGKTHDQWIEHSTFDSMSKQKIEVYEAKKELLVDFEVMLESLIREEELSPNWKVLCPGYLQNN